MTKIRVIPANIFRVRIFHPRKLGSLRETHVLTMNIQASPTQRNHQQAGKIRHQESLINLGFTAPKSLKAQQLTEIARSDHAVVYTTKENTVIKLALAADTTQTKLNVEMLSWEGELLNLKQVWSQSTDTSCRAFAAYLPQGKKISLYLGSKEQPLPAIEVEELYGSPLSDIPIWPKHLRSEVSKFRDIYESVYMQGFDIRDVSPANLFLTHDNKLVLLDGFFCGHVKAAAGFLKTCFAEANRRAGWRDG